MYTALEFHCNILHFFGTTMELLNITMEFLDITMEFEEHTTRFIPIASTTTEELRRVIHLNGKEYNSRHKKEVLRHP